MSASGGGNLYPNWLGSAALVIPNNQVVVNGNQVNVVPTVVGGIQRQFTWSDGNFVTFWTASNVSPGTYFVGCETFTDPLTTSNAGAGWNQGDYFVCRIIDTNGAATLAPQLFIRPYTEGIQVNATSPYNKGGTDFPITGILVVSSNTNIVWQAQFGKDVATSYPQTRQLSMESPYFQKIA